MLSHYDGVVQSGYSVKNELNLSRIHFPIFLGQSHGSRQKKKGKRLAFLLPTLFLYFFIFFQNEGKGPLKQCILTHIPDLAALVHDSLCVS